jgi:hypothetical protein
LAVERANALTGGGWAIAAESATEDDAGKSAMVRARAGFPGREAPSGFEPLYEALQASA